MRGRGGLWTVSAALWLLFYRWTPWAENSVLSNVCFKAAKQLLKCKEKQLPYYSWLAPLTLPCIGLNRWILRISEFDLPCIFGLFSQPLFSVSMNYCPYLSCQNCELWSILWNVIAVVKFGWNSKIFGGHSEMGSKIWNPVEIQNLC